MLQPVLATPLYSCINIFPIEFKSRKTVYNIIVHIAIHLVAVETSLYK